MVLENREAEKERASRKVEEQLRIQQAFARSVPYTSDSMEQKAAGKCYVQFYL